MSSEVEQQRALLRESVAQLCQKYDRNYWKQCMAQGRWVDEMWQEMGELGLLGLTIPEAYGGSGGGMTELALVMEELAHHGTAPLLLVVTGLSRIPILKYGTEEQRQRFLPKTATGELKLCFAITEPNAGTNTFKIETLATPQSDGSYRLSGQKIFISDIHVSDYALVVTRTTPYREVSDRRMGLTLFLVDLRAPGIELRPLNIGLEEPDKQFHVFFNDVPVPAENRLGEEGMGIRYLFDGLNPERQIGAASAIGSGYLALEKGVAYVKQRVVFGEDPIGRYQALQHPMAMARARLDAARLMLYRATERFDAGESAAAESNMAKLLASEAAFDAWDIVLQAHGGYGFDRDYEILQGWQASRLGKTAPVNNQMILNFIGEHVLGLPKSY